MLLRLSVGYHFFCEGTSKLRDGNFTAEYFLRAARGPFAPWFHGILEDETGQQRLCVVSTEGPGGEREFELDPGFTFALWQDFVDQARSYYRFGDQALLDEIADRRARLAEQIREARATGDRSVDTAALERQRDIDEQSILMIREQMPRSAEILAEHEETLRNWLAENRVEVLQHFHTRDRLDGFAQDGESRSDVAREVASLRDQVDTIRSDRQKQRNGWTAEIEAIWDSLEAQINALAVDRQGKQEPLPLHRQFDQEFSKLKTVNRIIPWFDTVLGALLIVGLFTRLAAAAGGLFLLSVICSQPPWIPGTTDTYYQTVEMFALLVLFATAAGRFGGLDFFFTAQPEPAEEPLRRESEGYHA